MGDGGEARELKKLTEPLRGGDICCGTFAEEAAHKSKKPEFVRCAPSLIRIAAEAFGLPAGHEVAGTRYAARLDEQLSVGTNGLKSVMLDYERLSRKQAEQQRPKRRAGDVNYIGVSNELPEFKETRLANRSEWIGSVVVVACGSLRGQSNFELGRAVRIAEFGEPARKGKNNGFDAADAGREKMRIEEKLHSGIFRRDSEEASLTPVPAAE